MSFPTEPLLVGGWDEGLGAGRRATRKRGAAVLAGPGFLMGSMHTTHRESYDLRNREHDGVHGGATYFSTGPWHTQVLQGSRASTTGAVARQKRRSAPTTAAICAGFRIRILQACHQKPPGRSRASPVNSGPCLAVHCRSTCSVTSQERARERERELETSPRSLGTISNARGFVDRNFHSSLP